MPFEGFLCEANGEPVAPPACLACARRGALPGCQMTAPVVKGILDGLRPDDFGLTVTTLLGCARKERLKQEVPYHLRPSETWWAYRGQLMHGVAAAFAEADGQALAEVRLSMQVVLDGRTVEISGQPDLVLLDRGHLIDFKTTKSVPRRWLTYVCPATGAVIREGAWPLRAPIACPHCGEAHDPKDVGQEGPPRPYRRHAEQIQLYRLLLWENGIEVRSAEIVYQDMAEQVRIPVDLWPLERARALLEARLALHLTEDLPGIVTDPEDVWECDWCPVRAACEALHGGPVGRAALNGDEG